MTNCNKCHETKAKCARKNRRGKDLDGFYLGQWSAEAALMSVSLPIYLSKVAEICWTEKGGRHFNNGDLNPILEIR